MIGRKSLTGELCPSSGIWRSEGRGKTAIARRQGDKMPRHRNKDVIWRKIQHLPKKLK